MKFSVIFPVIILILFTACDEGGTNHRTREEEEEWNELTRDKPSDVILVELFSEQFKWTARYAGMDNQLGKFDYKLTTGNNPLALMTSETIDDAIENMINGKPDGIHYIEKQLNDPNAPILLEDKESLTSELSRKERLIRLLLQMKEHHDKNIDVVAWDDFIQRDTLFLCIRKEYEFCFRSKDVIHSAYFPHFRAQMNSVPGMTTQFRFTPDITTDEMRKTKRDEKFNFVLLCNKTCGTGHYRMKMTVVVLETAAYNQWFNSKQNQTFKKEYKRRKEKASSRLNLEEAYIKSTTYN